MKKFIRKYTPRQLYALEKSLFNRLSSLLAYGHDRHRFLKNYARGGKSDTQVGIEAQVIFSTHQIEKGLSHVKFRSGFGKEALADLRSGLERLPSKQSTAYVAAISAIKAYLDIHREIGYDLSEQKNILGKSLIEAATSCKSNISGYMLISKSSKQNNQNKTFKELFNNRYTVREFSSEPVDIIKIHEAISLSTKTPTVCNRQSMRVLVLKDPDLIKQALSVQNGFRGYDYPPILTIILTDTRAFRGVTERNNQYIDGGSFMMSYLLSLEYEGLAACPLNTMFTLKEEKKARKILGLTDNYNFIAYVAIGNFRDSNKVAKSFRFSADEITVDVK